MKLKPSESMTNDWDALHHNEQVRAVIGKEMTPEAFWQSGRRQYVERIYPAIERCLEGGTRDKCVLEVGCGPGRLLRPLAENFRTAIGVDVSRSGVESARANLRDCANVIVQHTSGVDLQPIDSGAVDVVVSFDVFQHMPSLDVQRSNLREICRVLTRNGVFAIQIKTTTGWMKWRGIPLAPRFIRPFVPDSLVNGMLKILGYRPERLKSTWRGNLIRHSTVHDQFRECGLSVEAMIPDGKDVRWLVVGRKR